MKLRQDLEEKRERWGTSRKVNLDEEDEFDAMFSEAAPAQPLKEIGARD